MSNNFAAAITTQFLQKRVITPLQAKLAPLNAFATRFEPDPLKPLATCQIKYAASGSTTQVDPTDFTGSEDTGGTGGHSTLNSVGVTMHQMSHPFNITNKDLQSGIRLEDIFEINVKAFAQSVMDTVLAPVTTANFTAPPLLTSAGAFYINDLDQVWGAIAKSDIKNLILAGNYFIKVMNKPGFFQPTGIAPGTAWKPFGWDFIGQNDEWLGAEANTVGFACNPQAIGVVLGLPIYIPMPNVIVELIELPGIEAKCYMYRWFDGNARTLYVTLDLMLGTALLDPTAGVLIKSQ
jgi:hypothetical protein